MTTEVNKFLKNLLTEGLIFEKRVSKGNPSSGCIFVPKNLVGRRFRVMLIPMDEEAPKVPPKKVVRRIESVPMEEIGDRFTLDTGAKEEEYGLDG